MAKGESIQKNKKSKKKAAPKPKKSRAERDAERDAEWEMAEAEPLENLGVGDDDDLDDYADVFDMIEQVDDDDTLIDMLRRAGALAKPIKKQRQGGTVLHKLVIEGRVGVIKGLLPKSTKELQSAAGDLINHRDKQGKSALHVAVDSTSIECALQLMHFFKVDAEEDAWNFLNVHSYDKSGSTPLMAALRNAHWDLASQLLDHGVKKGLDKKQNNLLHCAMQGWVDFEGEDDEPAVLALTARVSEKFNAKIDGANAEGETPLHVAVTKKSGGAAVVKFLLSRGASIHSKTKQGQTAADIAATEGVADVLAVLAEAGAHVPDLEAEAEARAKDAMEKEAMEAERAERAQAAIKKANAGKYRRKRLYNPEDEEGEEAVAVEQEQEGEAQGGGEGEGVQSQDQNGTTAESRTPSGTKVPKKETKPKEKNTVCVAIAALFVAILVPAIFSAIGRTQ